MTEKNKQGQESIFETIKGLCKQLDHDFISFLKQIENSNIIPYTKTFLIIFIFMGFGLIFYLFIYIPQQNHTFLVAQCEKIVCQYCVKNAPPECSGLVKCEDQKCKKCPEVCNTFFTYKSELNCADQSDKCKADFDGNPNPDCFYTVKINCDDKTYVTPDTPECAHIDDIKPECSID